MSMRVAGLRPSGNQFSGEVNCVKIDIEGEDRDHMISPEEALPGRESGDHPEISLTV